MATNRDVKMTLSVDTLGEEGVKSLQQSIQKLASEGGTAAPEFQKLADEVGRLGEQGKALTAFKELATATDLLKEKQDATAQTAAKLSANLTDLKGATDAAKLKQQEATAALAAGQKENIAAATAIKELKTSYDNAAKQTADYRTKLTELVTAQGAAKEKLVELRTAQRDANSELSAAEAAQKKAEGAYTRSEKAAQSVTVALDKQTAAMRESATAANTLGMSTDDVATSEGTLLSALNKVGTEAAQHSAAIKEMAESDRLLAIEEKGLAALFARGADALQAETLAQRDADRSNAEYAASLAKVNAEKAKSVDTAAQWQREAVAIVDAAHAAQMLQKETEDLIRSEQQLAATNAFEQQLADAAKMVQAAEYVRFWTTELDKADVAAKQVQNAFNTLNIRTAEAIKADIVAVRVALETVRTQSLATGQSMTGAFTAGVAKVKALELELRQLNGTMTMGDKAAKLFSNSLGQISAGNLIADGIGYLVNKVKELGRAFLGAIVDGDQMRRGLMAIYKDAGTTAQQIEFLRKSSSESGVAFGALGTEFVRFSASMKMANVPMAQSNDLFRAVTAATASLGLGAEATSGTLNALGQMASKGVVSLEELRQQLGDRLPGAMGLTAQGLGITEAQLIKLVESGGLATRDFIVPFTKALGQLKGETDGLVPTWERFKGMLTETAQGVGDAGGIVLLTGTLKLLGGTVAVVSLGLSSVVEAMLLVGSGVTALAARLMGDSKAWEFFTDQVEKSRVRLTGQAEALNNMLDPSAKATAAVNAGAAAMSAHTAEVVKSITANTSMEAAQKLAALSTALAADATIDAAAKIVQYNVAAAELIKSQSVQTESFAKTAKAAKEEGDTLVALAKLTGDQSKIRLASIQAAELHAAALAKVAASQSAETAMLVAQKAELVASAEKRGLTSLQIKTQVDALDALITKSRAETEQSRQASAAAAQELLERKLLVATMKDHSGAVDTLKRAMDGAADSLRQYERLSLEGKKTDADVKAQREALAYATALYRDALGDVVVKLQAKQIAEKTASDVTLIGLNAQNSYLDAVIKTARANGDEAAALSATIQQKQIAIKVIQAKVAAMKAEADGAIAVANAELALLDISDKMYPVRKAQIDAAIKMAEARKLEAAAAGLAIGEIGREIDALRNGQTQLDGFRNSSASAANGQRDFAKATNEATAALEKQKGVQSTIPKATPTAFDNSFMFNVRDKLQTGKLTAADIPDVQNLVKTLDQNRDMDAWAREMGGMGVLGLEDSGNWQTTNQQLKDFLTNQAFKATVAKPTASTTAGAPATATPASNTTRTVNISINGRNQSVNVASDADANALTSILRSLESAANTSS